LPESTREWIPSEKMAELPLKYAAINLEAAIARFAAMAAKMAFGLSAIEIPLKD